MQPSFHTVTPRTRSEIPVKITPSLYPFILRYVTQSKSTVGSRRNVLTPRILDELLS